MHISTYKGTVDTSTLQGIHARHTHTHIHTHTHKTYIKAPAKSAYVTSSYAYAARMCHIIIRICGTYKHLPSQRGQDPRHSPRLCPGKTCVCHIIIRICHIIIRTARLCLAKTGIGFRVENRVCAQCDLGFTHIRHTHKTYI